MKKALDAHSRLPDPPMALIDGNNRMSTSPQESCTIMSDTLSKLGGAMDYTVPAPVEASFFNEEPLHPSNLDPPASTICIPLSVPPHGTLLSGTH